jgi:nicotinate-nucleotide adenylyltransferase
MDTKNKTKVALFGGSFNPIQNAHLKIIKTLIKRDLVDEVWIIPSKNHPFSKSLLSPEHRLNMIKLAIQDIPKAKINTIEIESDDITYTIHTIRKLKEKYDYEFFWIIGSDLLQEMPEWEGYQDLVKEASFILFKRPGYAVRKTALNIRHIIKVTPDISSTEIRAKIHKSKSLKNKIPSSIEEYIIKNKLYKDGI